MKQLSLFSFFAVCCLTSITISSLKADIDNPSSNQQEEDVVTSSCQQTQETLDKELTETVNQLFSTNSTQEQSLYELLKLKEEILQAQILCNFWVKTLRESLEKNQRNESFARANQLNTQNATLWQKSYDLLQQAYQDIDQAVSLLAENHLSGNCLIDANLPITPELTRARYFYEAGTSLKLAYLDLKVAINSNSQRLFFTPDSQYDLSFKKKSETFQESSHLREDVGLLWEQVIDQETIKNIITTIQEKQDKADNLEAHLWSSSQ